MKAASVQNAAAAFQNKSKKSGGIRKIMVASGTDYGCIVKMNRRRNNNKKIKNFMAGINVPAIFVDTISEGFFCVDCEVQMR